LFFRFTGMSAEVVAYVIAIWAIATGILEIVAAFRFGGQGSAPWLLGLAGILSIIVGLIFAVAPIPGLLAYVIVLGIYAIIFGILMVVWAFRLRSTGKALGATT